MKTPISNLLLLPVLIIGFGLIPAGRVLAQTFTNIYDFSGGSDGGFPHSGLILSGNTLYGTATSGGISGNGTVFAVNTDGTGFTTLHSFSSPNQYNINSDGTTPDGTLILSGNTLYGTAYYGGTNDGGTVFAVNTNGTNFMTLHSFSFSDGAHPYAGLILFGTTLYGTTHDGGSSGYGTVFKINTDGTGFRILHSFTVTSGDYGTNTDGTNPWAGLILSGNTLYGAAFGGGASGRGTVFAMNTNGTEFSTLHSFSVSDGGAPHAALILSGNTLYGTAEQGGSSENGSVFKVNIDGTEFSMLHSFSKSDGTSPKAGLILLGNTLFGTATYDGSLSSGTVFAVNTNGTGFMTLHNFSSGSDGAWPEAGLILSGNTLYGTASTGGISANGTVENGTVFSISRVFSISLALVVSTTSLPNGMTSATYDQTLTASGGQTPYTWTNISGVLPSGLTLAPNGTISGMPTTIGTFNFTVKVTDATNGTAIQPLTLTVLAPNMVLNGGFEMGNFSGWTSSGNFTYTAVITGSTYAHSGTYGAQLGPSGSLGYLSQTLATTAGTSYLFSFWLDSPNGSNPNEFLVSWNGNTLLDKTNLPAIGWTNIQFVVMTTGTSTVLQFGFRDDPSYLGLDDISVVSLTLPPTPVILSAPQITVDKTNFTFQLSGPAGSNFVVQASTNLLNWTPVSTSTVPVSGSITLSNAISGYKKSFYRAYMK